jgi:hypothetical protein
MSDSLLSFEVELSSKELNLSAYFFSSFTSIFSLEARSFWSEISTKFEKVSEQSCIDYESCILNPLS